MNLCTRLSQLRQHTLQPQLSLISLRFSCLTTISKNHYTVKTDVDLSVLQMYSFHIFADTIAHLACWNLVSVLYSWCANERLTFPNLCPSRFTGLISTLRMTASVNCTSVCPLTQRLARLLSKVRSGSDYNPFPRSALGLLCYFMTAAFPPHFTWDSHVTQKTGTSLRWPCLNQQSFIWLSSVALQTRISRWHCILVNRGWTDTTLRHWGLKGTPRISVLLDEHLKVSLGPNLLKASFNPYPPPKMAIWFVRWLMY